MQLHLEAPVEYRGHVIHLDDEEGCFTIHGKRRTKVWARDWPTLRTKIDTLEDY